MTQELQLPPTAINTRAAWRPVLRPVTALVLQPLSALAQEKGKSNTSPLVQSQINRINLLNRDVEAGKAQKLKDQASPADKASGDLAHIEEITQTLHADLRAQGLAAPARQSKAPGTPDAALRLQGS